MRMIVVVAALTLGAPCSGETSAPNDAHTIAYAKRIDVARLDPRLQTQSLEEWLRLGPARVEKLDWRVSDCDLKPDYEQPPNGYPLCVNVVFQRGRVSGWIIITVGTRRKGVEGVPRFELAVASTQVRDVMRTENAQSLSDLPRVMSKLLAEP